MKFLQIMKAYNNAIIRENAKLKNIYKTLLEEAGCDAPVEDDDKNESEELDEFELPLQNADEFFGKKLSEQDAAAKIDGDPVSKDFISADEFFKGVALSEEKEEKKEKDDSLNEADDDGTLLTASEFFNEEDDEQLPETDLMNSPARSGMHTGRSQFDRTGAEPDFDEQIEQARAGTDSGDVVDNVGKQMDQEKQDGDVVAEADAEPDSGDKASQKPASADDQTADKINAKTEKEK